MCITFAGSDIKLLGNQLQVLSIEIEEQKHHGGARAGAGREDELPFSLFMIVVHPIQATVFK